MPERSYEYREVERAQQQVEYVKALERVAEKGDLLVALHTNVLNVPVLSEVNYGRAVDAWHELRSALADLEQHRP